VCAEWKYIILELTFTVPTYCRTLLSCAEFSKGSCVEARTDPRNVGSNSEGSSRKCLSEENNGRLGDND
jgi:hypothetical protein